MFIHIFQKFMYIYIKTSIVLILSECAEIFTSTSIKIWVHLYIHTNTYVGKHSVIIDD